MGGSRYQFKEFLFKRFRGSSLCGLSSDANDRSHMRGSGAGSENRQGDAAAAFAPVYGLHPGTGNTAKVYETVDVGEWQTSAGRTL